MKQPEHQQGGRLLGKGVSGCVFEPMPRCADGKVLQQIAGLPVVGKVTTDDAATEVRLGRMLMRLPLAKAYFAVPVASCQPDLPIKDPDAARCNVLKETEQNPLSLLMMPKAGVELYQWGKNKTVLAENFIRLFVHLLEGMVIYQRAGIVHNDIHNGNIMVDAKGVGRYIDFGLAFRIKDVTSWGSANLSPTFRPIYLMQAPEIHALRMRNSGVAPSLGISMLQDIHPEYRQLEAQFPARQTALEAFTSVIITFDKDIVQLIQQYGKQIDAWRIGLCMWLQWQGLLSWSGLRETALWEQREVVRQVLGGLTDFNPARRWTPVKALATLDPTNRIASMAS